MTGRPVTSSAFWDHTATFMPARKLYVVLIGADYRCAEHSDDNKEATKPPNPHGRRSIRRKMGGSANDQAAVT
jgi:hypothetical protein